MTEPLSVLFLCTANICRSPAMELIARDLAGRSWSVVLCEQHDLAQHTSSASTKLVHGGLRYLEHGQIGEIVLQLRGEAGARQQPGARTGLAHMVGIGAVCYVHILQRPG